MDDETRFSPVFRVGAVLVLGLAVWFRITSLESIPDHNGDESYEGIQVARMLQGQSFTLFTSTSNLLDPFFLALQAPFHYLSPPSLWILRAPAVLSGLLAIAGTFVLGGRVLDRRTALVATLLLAAFPAAIFYSRMGHEYSQIPLVGVLALSFAFRGRPIGLAVTVVGGLLVHAINVFLLPVVVPLAFVQILRRQTGDRERLRRQVMRLGLAALAVFVPIVLFLLSRPIVRNQLTHRGPLDWEVFLRGVERFFLHQYSPHTHRAIALQSWIFWGVIGVVSARGMFVLVRDRRWDRLALVLGFVAQLVAFHLIGGPGKLSEYKTSRYGVIFLVPAAWSLAMLVEATFAGWVERRPSWARRFGREAFVLATSAVVLVTANANIFAPFTELSGESIWTLRSDRPDHFTAILSTIVNDAKQNATERAQGRPCVVVAETYWNQKPLEYLASWRDDVTIAAVDLRTMANQNGVVDAIRRGTYIVTYHPGLKLPANAPIARQLSAAFRPGELREWVFEDARGKKILSVYRLE